MRKYTKEQLLFYMKKLSSEFKRSPTIDEMDSKRGYPSSTTYANRFGSWNNALKEAGLKINLKKKYEKTELIESLRLLAKEIGKTPKAKDLKKRQWIASYSTYKKMFGSFRNALKESGLSRHSLISLQKYSKKKLI